MKWIHALWKATHDAYASICCPDCHRIVPSMACKALRLTNVT